jgi:hypothetical protein
MLVEIKLTRINFEISVLEVIQKAYGFAVFTNNFHAYTAVADEL